MIGYIIVLLVVFFLARSLLSDIAVINPFGAKEAEDETVIEGKFTPQTLVKYNGVDSPKVFIAVKGRVFDVSQGASFYGPGGPYANFAGRDASRGLAFNSFEKICLTPIDQPIDKLEDLTEGEKESLNNWEEHFENKYPIVGTLHENN
ncbi:hypothetical protein G9P44_006116 [Scheffersomyces stipitis]|nr:hypothetical protein G9P44_006116 [Scheffersomyces stipitis]